MKLTIPLLFVFLASCAPGPPTAGKLSLSETAALGEPADQQDAAIASFCQNAASANPDILLPAFSQKVRSEVGDPAIRDYLASEIIPFFADFNAVDTYRGIASAQFPGGLNGVIHYTYTRTDEGKFKPFSIALIREQDTFKVFNISVGECVPQRHPTSNGRCE